MLLNRNYSAYLDILCNSCNPLLVLMASIVKLRSGLTQPKLSSHTKIMSYQLVLQGLPAWLKFAEIR